MRASDKLHIHIIILPRVEQTLKKSISVFEASKTCHVAENVWINASFRRNYVGLEVVSN